MKQQLAIEIFNKLGGADNILSAYNCMTRLRVQLKKKDDSLIKSLKSIDGVLGVNDSETELQIILGTGAAVITSEINELINKSGINAAKQLQEEIKAKNATPAKLFLKKIAGIFIPIIPAFIACGLITGCVGAAIKVNPDMASYPIVKLLAAAGNTVFFGLNLFVGVNASKVFGGTPILGGILAALISHPALANIVLFNDPLLPGRGGIISVILVAALASYVERKLHKIIPEMFDLFLTPLLTFLISGTAAIIILQPIGGAISETIGVIATSAVQSGGALVGFILAGTWLPLVMFGIHQAFTPIHVDLISQFGVTILLPMLAMAGAGQVGASVAVFFKTKNSRLKKTIASALPAGIMGVGEPLIYGVTFPLGKPFITACFGGACGGAIQAHFMIGSSTIGISGLPLAAATNNVPIYLLGLVTAYAAGFIATYLVGFDDPQD